MNASKKTRVLLVTFNCASDITMGVFHKLLENHGYYVKTCFLYYGNLDDREELRDDSEQRVFLKKLLHDFRPHLVAFRVLTLYYDIARHLTQFIKKINPEVFVIWGGWHTMIEPEKCLESADAICVGEGDDAFIELLERIEENRPVSDIRNIWTKSSDKIIKTFLRPLKTDLDSLPAPDYSAKNKYVFIPEALAKKQRVFAFSHMFRLLSPMHSIFFYGRLYQTIASRGCPYNCGFCLNSFFRNFLEENSEKEQRSVSKCVRHRSVDSVIKELIDAKRLYRPIKIFFCDDCFISDKVWLKEFSFYYRRFIRIPFYCHILESFFCEDSAQYLKQANCMNVGVGIQSVSERVRREIFDRHVTDDKILEVNRILNKYKIDVEYHIIINNPYENFNEYRDGFKRVICRLKKPFIVKTSSLVFYKKTNISEKALKDNLIKPSQLYVSRNPGFIEFSKESRLNYRFQSAVHSISGKNYIPNFLIEKIVMGINESSSKKAFIRIVKRLRYILLLDYVLRRSFGYFCYLVSEKFLLKGNARCLLKSKVLEDRECIKRFYA